MMWYMIEMKIGVIMIIVTAIVIYNKWCWYDWTWEKKTTNLWENG